MDSVAYRVVFEPSFAWWLPATGLIFLLIGLAVTVFAGGWKKLFGLGVGVFALLWTATAAIGVYGQYARARDAARSTRTALVQGPVEHFDPAPEEGHKDESFTVQGVRFAYSDYVVTGGFRQSASHGGPIKEGLQVRIRYLPGDLGNIIVKLEVSP